MDIVFGPVYSRRFGRSLGVDLSPFVKQCNFDCVYCELKGAKSVDSMRQIVSLTQVIESVKNALKTSECDVLTLTANGEPTLYPYLKELISNLKQIVPDSVKLLLLTNGSLLWKEEVRECLKGLDIVKFSCDSLEEKAFKHIDRPHISLSLGQIKEGIVQFCKEFKGEIVAEVLFVKGINDNLTQAKEIAAFLASLPLHRVDIGSIDRPPAYKVEAVSEEKLAELAQCFYVYKHLQVNLPKRTHIDNAQKLSLSYTDSHSQITLESNTKSYTQPQLIGLLKRRPLSVIDTKKMFDTQTLALLDELCQKGEIKQCSIGIDTFYQIEE
ncbi:radical SAM protein [Helicobacter japonicus]|uniref:radical SAM protein n=1 Tax=Helicobacter japonicus TaxID=425400 RepID=UPI0023F4A86D|nr:radical SAM protein [Helicobacter japonicus]